RCSCSARWSSLVLPTDRLFGGPHLDLGAGHHPKSALVEVEQALLLVDLLLVHFTELDDLTHDLGLEAGSLGLGIDFLDVAAQRALFFLEPLDALDKGFQLLAGNAPDIRHGSPLSPSRCCPRSKGAEHSGRPPRAQGGAVD